MTEPEARAWIRSHFDVSRETALAAFVDLVVAEAEQQNLVSKRTIADIWLRHIVDSAQLVTLARREGAAGGIWIDVGTGAGFPGLVAAILRPHAPTILIEPRKRRVEFLERCLEALQLRDMVRICGSRAERVREGPARVISARAVAALPALFGAARHLANSETLWLLPKGASAQSEVAEARGAWQGSFHVEQSITHPESLIVVAREVDFK